MKSLTKALQSNRITFKSNFKAIKSDFEKEEMKSLKEAAQVTQGIIRAKIDQVGIKDRSGDLKKGIKALRGPHLYRVGAGSPASHAHLLEFGTLQRTVKNSRGRTNVKANAGQVPATPFMLPAFVEAVPVIEYILSRPWTK